MIKSDLFAIEVTEDQLCCW